MVRPSFPYGRCVALVLILIWGLGCGSKKPPTGELRGKVTFRSMPVSDGNVVCENCAKGLIQAAKLGQDGEFFFKALPATEYAISIQPPDIKILDENSDFNGSALMARAKVASPSNIPMAVRSTQTTPLRKRIEEGQNRFDIELTNLP